MGDNKLSKVKDEHTILNLLGSAKDSLCEVYVWKMVGSAKHLGLIRIESIRKARKDFCIVPSEGHDRVVQDLMSSQNHIDVYIPDSALLLRCQIKHTDAPYRYYLHLPEVVAQAERRKGLRLKVHYSSEVSISFAKTVGVYRTMTQHFLKSCYDISSGGFSFHISRVEAKFFVQGDRIPVVEIKAGNWSAKLEAEITNIREYGPDEYNNLTYKVWRVCCRFKAIDQISQKYLEKFIFERIKDELDAINK